MDVSRMDQMGPNDALISDDGRHRYALSRSLQDVQSTGLLVVIMVNPSTADASEDDPTIRRVLGFARSWKMQRVLVGNLFAYRATDIHKLAHLSPEDAIGPDNDRALRHMLRPADIVVAAWGSTAKLPPRLRDRWKDIVRICDEVGHVPHSIGATLCKDGHPMHPLYLAGDLRPVPWVVPWFPNRAPEAPSGISEDVFA
jgi:hypothetical protein